MPYCCDTCNRKIQYKCDVIPVLGGKYRCMNCAKLNPTLIIDIGTFHCECVPETMNSRQWKHMMAVLGKYMKDLSKSNK